MLTVLSSHVTSVASRKKKPPGREETSHPPPPGGHPTTTSGRSGHAVTRWEAGDGGDGWKQDPKENSNLSVLFSFFFQLVECISGRKSHRGDSRPHQVPPRGLLEKKQQNSPHPWRMRNVTPASLFFLHTHTHTDTATTPTTTATTQTAY